PARAIEDPRIISISAVAAATSEEHANITLPIVGHGCPSATRWVGLRMEPSPRGAIPSPCVAQKTTTVSNAAEQHRLIARSVKGHLAVSALRRKSVAQIYLA